MGNVAVLLKVMPKGADVDIEALKNRIAQSVHIKDAKIEPLAFGIKQLKILVITPDLGGTEALQQKIKSIEGVSEVEVESVTLI